MIKLVTDTTAGLTRELAAQHDIDLVSQVVLFGTEAFRDQIDISNEVFLQRLRTSKEFPKTSQPPVGDFVEVFQRHLEAGHEVLCLTVSTHLSGTYNSAMQARAQLGGDRITVIDSKTVAAAEALIVLEAARLIQGGRSLPDIEAQLGRWIAGMHLDFVLDTLEYLVKGGRASNIQGILGTLLQMKPLLTIRDGTGKIEALERIRTKNKAVARLRQVIDAAVKGQPRAHLAAVHVNRQAEAEAMASELRDRYHLPECPVFEMPPAVAAHAGPGALGAAYYVES